MRHSLLAVLLLVAMSGCGKSEPEIVVQKTPDQKERDAAIEQELEAATTHARHEVNSFITELSKPTGSNYAVKVPIQDKGQTEYFWLTAVSFKNDEFTGTIESNPQIVGNVKLGQSWTVKKNEISDWTFQRAGQTHGNYTLRPLLKTKNASNHPAMPGMIGG